MKEYGKNLFRSMIKWLDHDNSNVKTGDTLHIGAIFYDKDGKPSKIKPIVDIHKNEL